MLTSMTLIGPQAIPSDRFVVVDCGTLAAAVHHAQIILCLFGCRAIPLDGRFVIFVYALPIVVNSRQVELRGNVTAGCRLQISLDRLDPVYWNAEAFVVDQSDVIHCIEITVFGQWQPLVKRCRIVFGIERVQACLEVGGHQWAGGCHLALDQHKRLILGASFKQTT